MTQPGVTSRRLAPADWRALRAARLAALAGDPGNFFRPHAHDAALPDSHWIELLGNPEVAVFGLFEDTRLVGITAAFVDSDDPSGRTAGFGMSWIDPDYRGHGLTALLYRLRLDWAREHGFARVEVSHRASNEASRRAIARHGFTRIGSRPYVWPDGVAEEDIRYELKLAPEALG